MDERRTTDSDHVFGGSWTQAKLKVLASYLHSYTTALQNTPFRKGYIDAFAGSGYRLSSDFGETQESLFPHIAENQSQQLLDGSTRVALGTVPAFDSYVFIERQRERVESLERLRMDFPGLKIEIRQGDANEVIQDMCAKDWRRHRAVCFLDPYGMQVEWATISAIAHTKAIDLWLLFPLGMAVNRLLPKSGEIPQPWKRKLDILLGTEDWYHDFYSVEEKKTLFGTTSQVTKAGIETIGRYFNERLKTVFEGVVENPGILRNSTNNPLYLLCFAVGNPAGKRIALRIAGHLLKEVQ